MIGGDFVSVAGVAHSLCCQCVVLDWNNQGRVCDKPGVGSLWGG